MYDMLISLPPVSSFLLFFKTTTIEFSSALFYGHFLSLWSDIFKATNANPQPALIRVTDIWWNSTSGLKVVHFTR